MQATHAWYGPIERVPKWKREFLFTLIRVIIVVALIGAAARLITIAFAPQSPTLSQPLNCPPDVVTNRETVVSPQVLSVTEQSATSVTSGEERANESDRRSINGKEEEHQRGAKKPPAYAFARNSLSSKRGSAMGELAKRGGTDANHKQKSKASAPTLAHSGISPSPFGDMHGQ